MTIGLTASEARRCHSHRTGDSAPVGEPGAWRIIRRRSSYREGSLLPSSSLSDEFGRLLALSLVLSTDLGQRTQSADRRSAEESPH